MSQSWQAQGISNKSKLMSFWSESNVKISSMLVCIWMCRCRRRAAAYLIPRHFYTIANFSAMRYYFCSWTVFFVAVVDVVAVFFFSFLQIFAESSVRVSCCIVSFYIYVMHKQMSICIIYDHSFEYRALTECSLLLFSFVHVNLKCTCFFLQLFNSIINWLEIDLVFACVYVTLYSFDWYIFFCAFLIDSFFYLYFFFNVRKYVMEPSFAVSLLLLLRILWSWQILDIV